MFLGNFAGALTVALMMAVVFTYGFSVDPNEVGQRLGEIGHSRAPSATPNTARQEC